MQKVCEDEDTYDYYKDYEYQSTWLASHGDDGNEIIVLYKLTTEDVDGNSIIIYAMPCVYDVDASYLDNQEELSGFSAIYDSHMENPDNLEDAIETMKEQLNDYELTQFEE